MLALNIQSTCHIYLSHSWLSQRCWMFSWFFTWRLKCWSVAHWYFSKGIKLLVCDPVILLRGIQLFNFWAPSLFLCRSGKFSLCAEALNLWPTRIKLKFPYECLSQDCQWPFPYLIRCVPSEVYQVKKEVETADKHVVLGCFVYIDTREMNILVAHWTTTCLLSGI